MINCQGQRKNGRSKEQTVLKITPPYSLILSIKVRIDKMLNHLQFQQIVPSRYLILAQVLKVQAPGKSHFFSLIPNLFGGRRMKSKIKPKQTEPNSLKEKINKIVACVDNPGKQL